MGFEGWSGPELGPGQTGLSGPVFKTLVWTNSKYLDSLTEPILEKIVFNKMLPTILWFETVRMIVWLGGPVGWVGSHGLMNTLTTHCLAYISSLLFYCMLLFCVISWLLCFSFQYNNLFALSCIAIESHAVVDLSTCISY